MTRPASRTLAAVLVAALAACSKSKSDPPPPNSPPAIVRLLVAPDVVAPGGTVSLAVVASDPNGDPLSYEWQVPAGWTVQGPADQATLALQAPGTHGEAAFVRVQVKDGRGGVASELAAVRTTPAGTVQLRALSAGPSPVRPGGAVALAAVADSADGAAVSYAWSVSDPAWALSTSGASATLVAPYAYERPATVTVTASATGSAPATGKVVVATAAAAAPTIDSLLATPAVALPGDTLQLTATATAAYGLGVTYAWSVGAAGWTLAAAGARASLVAPAVAGAATTVTVTVTDAAGASSSSSVVVRTSDPTPVVSPVVATPAVVAPGRSSTLAVSATSPAGRPLTYAWTSSDPGWTLSGAGPVVTATAPLAYGQVAIVTVTVDDGSARATQRVVVSTTAAQPPAVTWLVATPSPVDPGGRIAVTADATSPAALPLVWSWTVTGAGWTVAGSGPTATVTAPLARASTALVTATVTDAAGATGSRTVSVATNDAPITTVSAVVAGASPLAGVVGRAVVLDASGTTSSGTGTLVYAWRVTSAPAGAAPSLVPSGSGATALLTGAVPGLYAVALVVTDAWGASGTATKTVTISGPATLQVVGGDAQTGTAGDELALPLQAVVRAATGESVPGVAVTWRVAGGRLLASSGASDANGVVRASVRLGRIAGPGQVRVTLRDTPSASATFGFTGQAGAPASIAVRAEQGTADTGVLVRVRAVDAYGNETSDASAGSATFALSASSGSGRAAFGAAVEGGVGALLSGAGTASIVGQLAAGRLDVRLTDPVAESVALSLGRDPAAGSPLPFSAWTVVVLDSAERGVAGWSLATGVEPWGGVTGAKAASPSQGFGIELSAAEAIVPGTSSMSRALGALPYPLVRLDFVHQATVTPAADPSGCTAQPALAVALRNGTAESPIRPAPVSGWPVQDACDGRDGFAATAAFAPAVLDLTDATAAGYTTLSFELASAPRAATVAAPVAWYVDDVRVQALQPAAWAGASTSARVRPGAPASVSLTTTTATWPVLYRQCVTGQRGPDGLDVVVSVLDANGNLTEESTYVLGLAWTGPATPASVSAGALVGDANPLLVRVDGGLAVLRFANPTGGPLTFTLSDPRTLGLALPTPLTVAATYYCHATGNGSSWSDIVPVGTITVPQAIRACETTYGAGGCTYSSGTVMPTGYSSSCASFWRWTLTGGFSSYCGGAGAATATYGYWSNYGYGCGWWCYYYCTGGCGTEGAQQFRATAGGASWN